MRQLFSFIAIFLIELLVAACASWMPAPFVGDGFAQFMAQHHRNFSSILIIGEITQLHRIRMAGVSIPAFRVYDACLQATAACCQHFFRLPKLS